MVEGSSWKHCRMSVEGGREGNMSLTAGVSRQPGWSERKEKILSTLSSWVSVSLYIPTC